MVTAREGHLVTVHNDVFVALEEVLLEAFGVNHGWAQVNIVCIKTASDAVSVSGADLEVTLLEVALGAALKGHSSVHQFITVHARSLHTLLV